jgi:syntaxin 7
VTYSNRRSVASEERGSVELEHVQVQRQALAPQITQHELEFQEQLIAEREGEIREIESGIHELNDIFRDLGAIIYEQGGLIGELESRPGNGLGSVVLPPP